MWRKVKKQKAKNETSWKGKRASEERIRRARKKVRGRIKALTRFISFKCETIYR